MTRSQRQAIYDKYGGRCAYCGCELGARWHADHLIPIRRSWRNMRDDNGDYVRDEWGKPLTENYLVNPEADCIENMVPACPSCNIHKNSLPLESFRAAIASQIEILRRDRPTFRLAERYGLIKCEPKEVVFYFERLD